MNHIPALTIHPALPDVVKNLRNLDGVRQVILYGSRARGDHRPRSDIDLALEGQNIDWHRAETMVEDAGTLLQISLCDLGTLAPDHPLYQEIQRDGKILDV